MRPWSMNMMNGLLQDWINGIVCEEYMTKTSLDEDTAGINWKLEESYNFLRSHGKKSNWDAKKNMELAIRFVIE